MIVDSKHCLIYANIDVWTVPFCNYKMTKELKQIIA